MPRFPGRDRGAAAVQPEPAQPRAFGGGGQFLFKYEKDGVVLIRCHGLIRKLRGEICLATGVSPAGALRGAGQLLWALPGTRVEVEQGGTTLMIA